MGVAVDRAAAQNQNSAPSTAAAPAPGTDVLSQLDPAPTLAELDLYKKTITKSPGDLPKFLATRKYLRQLWAAFPDGKLDVGNAPAPSSDVDYGMCVSEKEMWFLLPLVVAAHSKGGTQ